MVLEPQPYQCALFTRCFYWSINIYVMLSNNNNNNK